MKRTFLLAAVLFLLLPVFGQVGKVGINTTAPAAMLHVKDSSVLFTGMASLPAIPGNTPVSGSGIRMMWYPDKAAFRAGRVTDLSWDKDSIGNYSVGLGYDAKAKGNYSIALGHTSYALGQTATAFGFGTIAGGDFSTAFGYGAEATGNRSIAMGYLAFARGEYSLAFGKKVSAMANNAVAIGDGAVAEGVNSIALGQNSLGAGNTSIALGPYAEANGDLSASLGYSNKANSSFSTSFGVNSIANGEASITLGNGVRTAGHSSIATGYLTTANGHYSTAVGNLTIANPQSSFVLGRYNDTTYISKTAWDNNDALFIIGNGTGPAARNNAITVLKNGNTGIGVISPAEKLVIAGKTVTTNFQMTNGAALNRVLQSDASGNASWGTETDPKVLCSTSNYVPRWNGTALVNGTMQDDGTNIGIGTAPAASSKLIIAGKTSTTNFQMTNGAGANKVMQSDASGNASWNTELTIVTVNATYFNYQGPQTRYLNIPASGFQLMPVNGTSTAGLSSATISGGQTLVTGTAGVAARFEAPVNVPEDAIITGVLLYVRDASATYEVSADLLEQNAFSSTVVASVAGTGAAAAPNETTIAATGLNIPTNKFLSYFLRFNTIEFNGNLRVYYARITYTVDKAD